MNGVMHVTVTGDLDKISDFSERINECYHMFQGSEHEGFGDLFYDGLHCEWHVERKERKQRKRGGKVEPAHSERR